MRKLRLQKVKKTSQGYIDNKWQLSFKSKYIRIKVYAVTHPTNSLARCGDCGALGTT